VEGASVALTPFY